MAEAAEDYHSLGPFRTYYLGIQLRNVTLIKAAKGSKSRLRIRINDTLDSQSIPCSAKARFAPMRLRYYPGRSDIINVELMQEIKSGEEVVVRSLGAGSVLKDGLVSVKDGVENVGLVNKKGEDCGRLIMKCAQVYVRFHYKLDFEEEKNPRYLIALNENHRGGSLLGQTPPKFKDHHMSLLYVPGHQEEVRLTVYAIKGKKLSPNDKHSSAVTRLRDLISHDGHTLNMQSVNDDTVWKMHVKCHILFGEEHCDHHQVSKGEELWTKAQKLNQSRINPRDAPGMVVNEEYLDVSMNMREPKKAATPQVELAEDEAENVDDLFLDSQSAPASPVKAPGRKEAGVSSGAPESEEDEEDEEGVFDFASAAKKGPVMQESGVSAGAPEEEDEEEEEWDLCEDALSQKCKVDVMPREFNNYQYSACKLLLLSAENKFDSDSPLSKELKVMCSQFARLDNGCWLLDPRSPATRDLVRNFSSQGMPVSEEAASFVKEFDH